MSVANAAKEKGTARWPPTKNGPLEQRGRRGQPGYAALRRVLQRGVLRFQCPWSKEMGQTLACPRLAPRLGRIWYGCSMINDLNVEQAATAAISQARLLAHQSSLAADAAIAQAVTLLLDSGMSQRAVAQVTGVSKSSVARMAKSRPPLGVVVGMQQDARVYAFANEWIWGSQANARSVVDQLLRTAGSPA